MEAGDGHEALPLAEELLVIDSCLSREEESVSFFSFFKGVASGRCHMPNNVRC